MVGDRRYPRGRLDRTQLQKGIALADRPPTARHLHAISDAQRRLPIERDLGSTYLQRFIPSRCWNTPLKTQPQLVETNLPQVEPGPCMTTIPCGSWESRHMSDK